MRKIDWFAHIPFPIQSVTEVFDANQYQRLVSRNLRIELLDGVSDHFVPFVGADQSENV
jgi:hypothetical protein